MSHNVNTPGLLHFPPSSLESRSPTPHTDFTVDSTHSPSTTKTFPTAIQPNNPPTDTSPNFPPNLPQQDNHLDPDHPTSSVKLLRIPKHTIYDKPLRDSLNYTQRFPSWSKDVSLNSQAYTSFNLQNGAPKQSDGLFSKLFSSTQDSPTSQPQQKNEKLVSEIRLNDIHANRGGSITKIGAQGQSSSTSNQPGQSDGTSAPSSSVLSRDFWLSDDQSSLCYDCNKAFSFLRRRHHCRLCGRLFCSNCSKYRLSGELYGLDGTVRACQTCSTFASRQFQQQTNKKLFLPAKMLVQQSTSVTDANPSTTISGSADGGNSTNKGTERTRSAPALPSHLSFSLNDTMGSTSSGVGSEGSQNGQKDEEAKSGQSKLGEQNDYNVIIDDIFHQHQILTFKRVQDVKSQYLAKNQAERADYLFQPSESSLFASQSPLSPAKPQTDEASAQSTQQIDLAQSISMMNQQDLHHHFHHSASGSESGVESEEGTSDTPFSAYTSDEEQESDLSDDNSDDDISKAHEDDELDHVSLLNSQSQTTTTTTRTNEAQPNSSSRMDELREIQVSPTTLVTTKQTKSQKRMKENANGQQRPSRKASSNSKIEAVRKHHKHKTSKELSRSTSKPFKTDPSAFSTSSILSPTSLPTRRDVMFQSLSLISDIHLFKTICAFFQALEHSHGLTFKLTKKWLPIVYKFAKHGASHIQHDPLLLKTALPGNTCGDLSSSLNFFESVESLYDAIKIKTIPQIHPYFYLQYQQYQRYVEQQTNSQQQFDSAVFRINGSSPRHHSDNRPLSQSIHSTATNSPTTVSNMLTNLPFFPRFDSNSNHNNNINNNNNNNTNQHVDQRDNHTSNLPNEFQTSFPSSSPSQQFPFLQPHHSFYFDGYIFTHKPAFIPQFSPNGEVTLNGGNAIPFLSDSLRLETNQPSPTDHVSDSNDPKQPHKWKNAQKVLETTISTEYMSDLADLQLNPYTSVIKTIESAIKLPKNAQDDKIDKAARPDSAQNSQSSPPVSNSALDTPFDPSTPQAITQKLTKVVIIDGSINYESDILKLSSLDAISTQGNHMLDRQLLKILQLQPQVVVIENRAVPEAKQFFRKHGIILLCDIKLGVLSHIKAVANAVLHTSSAKGTGASFVYNAAMHNDFFGLNVYVGHTDSVLFQDFCVSMGLGQYPYLQIPTFNPHQEPHTNGDNNAINASNTHYKPNSSQMIDCLMAKCTNPSHTHHHETELCCSDCEDEYDAFFPHRHLHDPHLSVLSRKQQQMVLSYREKMSGAAISSRKSPHNSSHTHLSSEFTSKNHEGSYQRHKAGKNYTYTNSTPSKSQRLPHLFRSTRTPTFQNRSKFKTITMLAAPTLLNDYNFQQSQLKSPTSQTTKTTTTSIPHRYCSIVLTGACTKILKVIKHILRQSIIVAYTLRLETSFLFDMQQTYTPSFIAQQIQTIPLFYRPIALSLGVLGDVFSSSQLFNTINKLNQHGYLENFNLSSTLQHHFRLPLPQRPLQPYLYIDFSTFQSHFITNLAISAKTIKTKSTDLSALSDVDLPQHHKRRQTTRRNGHSKSTHESSIIFDPFSRGEHSAQQQDDTSHQGDDDDDGAGDLHSLAHHMSQFYSFLPPFFNLQQTLVPLPHAALKSVDQLITTCQSTSTSTYNANSVNTMAYQLGQSLRAWRLEVLQNIYALHTAETQNQQKRVRLLKSLKSTKSNEMDTADSKDGKTPDPAKKKADTITTTATNTTSDVSPARIAFAEYPNRTFAINPIEYLLGFSFDELLSGLRLDRLESLSRGAANGKTDIQPVSLTTTDLDIYKLQSLQSLFLVSPLLYHDAYLLTSSNSTQPFSTKNPSQLVSSAVTPQFRSDQNSSQPYSFHPTSSHHNDQHSVTYTSHPNTAPFINFSSHFNIHPQFRFILGKEYTHKRFLLSLPFSSPYYTHLAQQLYINNNINQGFGEIDDGRLSFLSDDTSRLSFPSASPIPLINSLGIPQSTTTTSHSSRPFQFSFNPRIHGNASSRLSFGPDSDHRLRFNIPQQDPEQQQRRHQQEFLKAQSLLNQYSTQPHFSISYSPLSLLLRITAALQLCIYLEKMLFSFLPTGNEDKNDPTPPTPPSPILSNYSLAIHNTYIIPLIQHIVALLTHGTSPTINYLLQPTAQNVSPTHLLQLHGPIALSPLASKQKSNATAPFDSVPTSNAHLSPYDTPAKITPNVVTYSCTPSIKDQGGSSFNSTSSKFTSKRVNNGWIMVYSDDSAPTPSQTGNCHSAQHTMGNNQSSLFAQKADNRLNNKIFSTPHLDWAQISAFVLAQNLYITQHQQLQNELVRTCFPHSFKHRSPSTFGTAGTSVIDNQYIRMLETTCGVSNFQLNKISRTKTPNQHQHPPRPNAPSRDDKGDQNSATPENGSTYEAENEASMMENAHVSLTDVDTTLYLASFMDYISSIVSTTYSPYQSVLIPSPSSSSGYEPSQYPIHEHSTQLKTQFNVFLAHKTPTIALPNPRSTSLLLAESMGFTPHSLTTLLASTVHQYHQSGNELPPNLINTMFTSLISSISHQVVLPSQYLHRNYIPLPLLVRSRLLPTGPLEECFLDVDSFYHSSISTTSEFNPASTSAMSRGIETLNKAVTTATVGLTAGLLGGGYTKKVAMHHENVYVCPQEQLLSQFQRDFDLVCIVNDLCRHYQTNITQFNYHYEQVMQAEEEHQNDQLLATSNNFAHAIVYDSDDEMMDQPGQHEMIPYVALNDPNTLITAPPNLNTSQEVDHRIKDVLYTYLDAVMPVTIESVNLAQTLSLHYFTTEMMSSIQQHSIPVTELVSGCIAMTSIRTQHRKRYQQQLRLGLAQYIDQFGNGSYADIEEWKNGSDSSDVEVEVSKPEATDDTASATAVVVHNTQPDQRRQLSTPLRVNERGKVPTVRKFLKDSEKSLFTRNVHIYSNFSTTSNDLNSSRYGSDCIAPLQSSMIIPPHELILQAATNSNTNHAARRVQIATMPQNTYQSTTLPFSTTTALRTNHDTSSSFFNLDVTTLLTLSLKYLRTLPPISTANSQLLHDHMSSAVEKSNSWFSFLSSNKVAKTTQADLKSLIKVDTNPTSMLQQSAFTNLTPITTNIGTAAQVPSILLQFLDFPSSIETSLCSSIFAPASLNTGSNQNNPPTRSPANSISGEAPSQMKLLANKSSGKRKTNKSVVVHFESEQDVDVNQISQSSEKSNKVVTNTNALTSKRDLAFILSRTNNFGNTYQNHFPYIPSLSQTTQQIEPMSVKLLYSMLPAQHELTRRYYTLLTSFLHPSLNFWPQLLFYQQLQYTTAMNLLSSPTSSDPRGSDVLSLQARTAWLINELRQPLFSSDPFWLFFPAEYTSPISHLSNHMRTGFSDPMSDTRRNLTQVLSNLPLTHPLPRPKHRFFSTTFGALGLLEVNGAHEDEQWSDDEEATNKAGWHHKGPHHSPDDLNDGTLLSTKSTEVRDVITYINYPYDLPDVQFHKCLQRQDAIGYVDGVFVGTSQSQPNFKLTQSNKGNQDQLHTPEPSNLNTALIPQNTEPVLVLDKDAHPKEGRDKDHDGHNGASVKTDHRFAVSNHDVFDTAHYQDTGYVTEESTQTLCVMELQDIHSILLANTFGINTSSVYPQLNQFTTMTAQRGPSAQPQQSDQDNHDNSFPLPISQPNTYFVEAASSRSLTKQLERYIATMHREKNPIVNKQSVLGTTGGNQSDVKHDDHDDDEDDDDGEDHSVLFEFDQLNSILTPFLLPYVQIITPTGSQLNRPTHSTKLYHSPFSLQLTPPPSQHYQPPLVWLDLTTNINIIFSSQETQDLCFPPYARSLHAIYNQEQVLAHSTETINNITNFSPTLSQTIAKDISLEEQILDLQNAQFTNPQQHIQQQQTQHLTLGYILLTLFHEKQRCLNAKCKQPTIRHQTVIATATGRLNMTAHRTPSLAFRLLLTDRAKLELLQTQLLTFADHLRLHELEDNALYPFLYDLDDELFHRKALRTREKQLIRQSIASQSIQHPDSNRNIEADISSPSRNAALETNKEFQKCQSLSQSLYQDYYPRLHQAYEGVHRSIFEKNTPLLVTDMFTQRELDRRVFIPEFGLHPSLSLQNAQKQLEFDQKHSLDNHPLNSRNNNRDNNPTLPFSPQYQSLSDACTPQEQLPTFQNPIAQLTSRLLSPYNSTVVSTSPLLSHAHGILTWISCRICQKNSCYSLLSYDALSISLFQFMNLFLYDPSDATMGIDPLTAIKPMCYHCQIDPNLVAATSVTTSSENRSKFAKKSTVPKKYNNNRYFLRCFNIHDIVITFSCDLTQPYNIVVPGMKLLTPTVYPHIKNQPMVGITAVGWERHQLQYQFVQLSLFITLFCECFIDHLKQLTTVITEDDGKDVINWFLGHIDVEYKVLQNIVILILSENNIYPYDKPAFMHHKYHSGANVGGAGRAQWIPAKSPSPRQAPPYNTATPTSPTLLDEIDLDDNDRAALLQKPYLSWFYIGHIKHMIFTNFYRWNQLLYELLLCNILTKARNARIVAYFQRISNTTTTITTTTTTTRASTTAPVATTTALGPTQVKKPLPLQQPAGDASSSPFHALNQPDLVQSVTSPMTLGVQSPQPQTNQASHSLVSNTISQPQYNRINRGATIDASNLSQLNLLVAGFSAPSVTQGVSGMETSLANRDIAQGLEAPFSINSINSPPGNFSADNLNNNNSSINTNVSTADVPQASPFQTPLSPTIVLNQATLSLAPTNAYADSLATIPYTQIYAQNVHQPQQSGQNQFNSNSRLLHTANSTHLVQNNNAIPQTSQQQQQQQQQQQPQFQQLEAPVMQFNSVSNTILSPSNPAVTSLLVDINTEFSKTRNHSHQPLAQRLDSLDELLENRFTKLFTTLATAGVFTIVTGDTLNTYLSGNYTRILQESPLLHPDTHNTRHLSAYPYKRSLSCYIDKPDVYHPDKYAGEWEEREHEHERERERQQAPRVESLPLLPGVLGLLNNTFNYEDFGQFSLFLLRSLPPHTSSVFTAHTQHVLHKLFSAVKYAHVLTANQMAEINTHQEYLQALYFQQENLSPPLMYFFLLMTRYAYLEVHGNTNSINMPDPVITSQNTYYTTNGMHHPFPQLAESQFKYPYQSGSITTPAFYANTIFPLITGQNMSQQVVQHNLPPSAGMTHISVNISQPTTMLAYALAHINHVEMIQHNMWLFSSYIQDTALNPQFDLDAKNFASGQTLGVMGQHPPQQPTDYVENYMYFNQSTQNVPASGSTSAAILQHKTQQDNNDKSASPSVTYVICGHRRHHGKLCPYHHISPPQSNKLITPAILAELTPKSYSFYTSTESATPAQQLVQKAHSRTKSGQKNGSFVFVNNQSTRQVDQMTSPQLQPPHEDDTLFQRINRMSTFRLNSAQQINTQSMKLLLSKDESMRYSRVVLFGLISHYKNLILQHSYNPYNPDHDLPDISVDTTAKRLYTNIRADSIFQDNSIRESVLTQYFRNASIHSALHGLPEMQGKGKRGGSKKTKKRHAPQSDASAKIYRCHCRCTCWSCYNNDLALFREEIREYDAEIAEAQDLDELEEFDQFPNFSNTTSHHQNNHHLDNHISGSFDDMGTSQSKQPKSKPSSGLRGILLDDHLSPSSHHDDHHYHSFKHIQSNSNTNDDSALFPPHSSAQVNYPVLQHSLSGEMISNQNNTEPPTPSEQLQRIASNIRPLTDVDDQIDYLNPTDNKNNPTPHGNTSHAHLSPQQSAHNDPPSQIQSPLQQPTSQPKPYIFKPTTFSFTPVPNTSTSLKLDKESEVPFIRIRVGLTPQLPSQNSDVYYGCLSTYTGPEFDPVEDPHPFASTVPYIGPGQLLHRATHGIQNGDAPSDDELGEFEERTITDGYSRKHSAATSVTGPPTGMRRSRQNSSAASPVIVPSQIPTQRTAPAHEPINLNAGWTSFVKTDLVGPPRSNTHQFPHPHSFQQQSQKGLLAGSRPPSPGRSSPAVTPRQHLDTVTTNFKTNTHSSVGSDGDRSHFARNRNNDNSNNDGSPRHYLEDPIQQDDIEAYAEFSTFPRLYEILDLYHTHRYEHNLEVYKAQKHRYMMVEYLQQQQRDQELQQTSSQPITIELDNGAKAAFIAQSSSTIHEADETYDHDDGPSILTVQNQNIIIPLTFEHNSNTTNNNITKHSLQPSTMLSKQPLPHSSLTHQLTMQPQNSTTPVATDLNTSARPPHVSSCMYYPTPTTLIPSAAQTAIFQQHTQSLPVSKYSFMVDIYFPLEFHAIRTLYCGGDVDIISSLCQSASWNASGGKSGSTFAKTNNNKYILKYVSSLEFQMMLKTAQNYFFYTATSANSQTPSALVRILGLYTICLARKETKEKRSKKYVVLMSNLFYGREHSVDYVFDLKGSLRNRYIKEHNYQHVLDSQHRLTSVNTNDDTDPNNPDDILGDKNEKSRDNEDSQVKNEDNFGALVSIPSSLNDQIATTTSTDKLHGVSSNLHSQGKSDDFTLVVPPTIAPTTTSSLTVVSTPSLADSDEYDKLSKDSDPTPFKQPHQLLPKTYEPPSVTSTPSTLLDMNLIEFLCGSSLPLTSSTFHYLKTAAYNDSTYLTSLTVVDYSLLIAIDNTHNEIICGIIDYARQYTWDKRFETSMKKMSNVLAGKVFTPTVIPPDLYQHRFLLAIERYFYPVPDNLTLPDSFSMMATFPIPQISIDLYSHDKLNAYHLTVLRKYFEHSLTETVERFNTLICESPRTQNQLLYALYPSSPITKILMLFISQILTSAQSVLNSYQSTAGSYNIYTRYTMQQPHHTFDTPTSHLLQSILPRAPFFTKNTTPLNTLSSLLDKGMIISNKLHQQNPLPPPHQLQIQPLGTTSMTVIDVPTTTASSLPPANTTTLSPPQLNYNASPNTPYQTTVFLQNPNEENEDPPLPLPRTIWRPDTSFAFIKQPVQGKMSQLFPYLDLPAPQYQFKVRNQGGPTFRKRQVINTSTMASPGANPRTVTTVNSPNPTNIPDSTTISSTHAQPTPKTQIDQVNPTTGISHTAVPDAPHITASPVNTITSNPPSTTNSDSKAHRNSTQLPSLPESAILAQSQQLSNPQQHPTHGSSPMTILTSTPSSISTPSTSTPSTPSLLSMFAAPTPLDSALNSPQSTPSNLHSLTSFSASSSQSSSLTNPSSISLFNAGFEHTIERSKQDEIKAQLDILRKQTQEELASSQATQSTTPNKKK